MPSLPALVSLPDSAYGAGVSALTKPAWAEAIAKRRQEVLKVSQEAIAALSGDALTQSDVSRIERGLLHPLELTVPKFFGLLRGLGWSVDEFSEATGLDVPFASESQAAAIEATAYLQVNPDYVQFPVFNTASAGLVDAQPIEGGVAFIPRSKLIEKGADPRHVIVYRVNGDCMVSTEAKLMEKNIVHGDHIAVDTRRSPKPGDTVVAWWPDEQKLVVKRFRIEREGIVLYPLAPAQPALVLPHEDHANIIGVVIWRAG